MFLSFKLKLPLMHCLGHGLSLVRPWDPLSSEMRKEGQAPSLGGVLNSQLRSWAF